MMKKEHGCFWCPFRKGRICSYGDLDLFEKTTTESIEDLRDIDLGDTIGEGYRGKRIGFECYKKRLRNGDIPEWRIA